MIRGPPNSTRTDTLLPDPTLFRSPTQNTPPVLQRIVVLGGCDRLRGDVGRSASLNEQDIEAYPNHQRLIETFDSNDRSNGGTRFISRCRDQPVTGRSGVGIGEAQRLAQPWPGRVIREAAGQELLAGAVEEERPGLAIALGGPVGEAASGGGEEGTAEIVRTRDALGPEAGGVAALGGGMTGLGVGHAGDVLWSGAGRSEEHTSELQSLMRTS